MARSVIVSFESLADPLVALRQAVESGVEDAELLYYDDAGRLVRRIRFMPLSGSATETNGAPRCLPAAAQTSSPREWPLLVVALGLWGLGAWIVARFVSAVIGALR